MKAKSRDFNRSSRRKEKNRGRYGRLQHYAVPNEPHLSQCRVRPPSHTDAELDHGLYFDQWDINKASRDVSTYAGCDHVNYPDYFDKRNISKLEASRDLRSTCVHCPDRVRQPSLASQDERPHDERGLVIPAVQRSLVPWIPFS